VKDLSKWQDILVVALRAALLAVLTLLADGSLDGRPSAVLQEGVQAASDALKLSGS